MPSFGDSFAFLFFATARKSQFQDFTLCFTSMKHFESLEQVLSSHFGTSVQILRRVSLSGGSIHHAERLETSAGTFFVKHNHASHYENFLAEVDGLERLRQTRTLRVPQTILVTKESDTAYLVLEYLDAHPPAKNFWEHFGESLAALHRHQAEHFGYERDNFIGALVQRNTLHSSWSEFFIEERLSPMIARACRSGLLSASEAKRLEQLFPKLEQFFPDEPPALLHGDLWSGNFLSGPQGLPVVFDPAVYFGHREAEIAFMHLFGGFHERLFQAYHATFPLAPQWQARMDVYNLYPLLVHLNLFGRAYWSGIERTLRRFSL
jgi:fructosamine-3-kinase